MSQESITIDGQEYNLSDLSDEVKSLIELWSTAQQQFHEHRRKAVINEYAATNFSQMISQKVQGDGRPEVLGSDQPDNDS